MADTDLQRISDELAIRGVLDEYCLRLEVNAFEEWLDLFTEDTVYHVFRRALRGREELGAMLSLAPHGVHVPGALRIEHRLVSAQHGPHAARLEDSRDQNQDRANW